MLRTQPNLTYPILAFQLQGGVIYLTDVKRFMEGIDNENLSSDTKNDEMNETDKVKGVNNLPKNMGRGCDQVSQGRGMIRAC